LARHTDFRRLWIGDSISQLGTQLSGLALPLLAVTVLNAQPGQMGVLTAAQTLAFLLIGLPAGAWVDRWRCRRVLISNDLIRAVAFGTVPVAWWAGVLTLGQLYVIALVVGICTLFFDVAYQSYLPEIVAPEQVVEGNAKLQASESLARVAGPAVGGVLLRVIAPAALLGLDALSYLASAGFVARIRQPDRVTDRAGRRKLTEEIREGLAYVVRQPLLRRIIACTAGSNLFSSIGAAVQVIFMVRMLHLNGATIGLVLAVGAVGGVLGALGADRAAAWLGAGRAIPVSALACGLGAAGLPLAALAGAGAGVVAVVAAGDFVAGWGVVVYNVTQVSFRQRLCPPALLGRMNASVRFMVWGTVPIGGLIGGALGTVFGPLPTLVVVTVGELLAATPVLFSPLIRMRDLPGSPSVVE
jgi:Na+/melibiose symporter-like transporter